MLLAVQPTTNDFKSSHLAGRMPGLSVFMEVCPLPGG
jgi:hypothetical protein